MSAFENDKNFSSPFPKLVDFTDDEDSLCDFVRNVGNTGGGDFEECYELVLSEAHEKLTWREGAQKSLVVIGDATPHEVRFILM